MDSIPPATRRISGGRRMVARRPAAYGEHEMRQNPRYCSAKEAIGVVQSGHRLFVHGASAFPQVLIDALVARAAELRDVEIVHLHTNGNAAYVDPAYAGIFHHRALFVGS